jgi:FtsH-binding integral membrane protein
MYQDPIDQLVNSQSVAAEQASFMTKVYGWMTLALCITGITAFLTAINPEMVELLFSNSWTIWVLILGTFGLVGWLTIGIQKMSASTATLVFLGYSLLNGLIFSSIFLTYTGGSIALTFFITAGTFGVMSAYGYFTKSDLTSIGNIAIMLLIGVIIASIVNMFMKSEMLYWIISYAGVAIFVALTAYDTQKIKEMNIIGNEGTAEDRKEAIVGALTLYLDFINLFLFLLRLFGRRD